MAGRKKEKRREKKCSKSGGKEQKVWYTFAPEEKFGSSSSSSGDKVVRVSPDECFEKMKESFDMGPLGGVMDGMMRNLVRGTQQAWTKQFGSLPCLKGKTLVWLQLLLTDDERVIQGKFYSLGAVISMADEDDGKLVQRSRDLFREASPFLLEGGDAGNDPPHWVFSRSKVLANYNGSIDTDMVNFASYDPLDSLLELPKDIPSGVRCTEAFLFFAGDLAVGQGGLSTREAVVQFVRDLTSAEGILKLDAFTVCCGSSKVSKKKIEELKKVHLTA